MMLELLPIPVEAEAQAETDPVHWGCCYAKDTGNWIALCGQDCNGQPEVVTNDPAEDCAMCVYEAHAMVQTHVCPISGKTCTCRIIRRGNSVGLG